MEHKTIIGVIAFFLGATVMYFCTPSEQKPPAADLIIWTSNSSIYIPITKEKAQEFNIPGLQVNGVSVKGRAP